MLISEFIDRTGFRPTADYYHTVIEPEYNASELEKDAWCKQWKKNGGIQKAYNAMKEDAANEFYNNLYLEEENKKLREQITSLRDENKDLSKTNDELISDNDAHIALMYSLIDISERSSSAELREVIINEIGFKNYIAYKFEHDMNIWQLDRDAIIENLK
jgi:uncharacterized protein involved in exopolysaccharide biosynthesis